MSLLGTIQPTIPFDDPVGPPFPLHVLPAWLGRFVAAVARTTQTPPDLAAMLGLAVLGAALAKRVAVRAYPGWVEPVNLYVVVALPPANRKSAIFSVVTAPLAKFERDELARLKPAAAEAENQRRIAEQLLAQAQQAAARAKPEDRAALIAEADRQASELAAVTVPSLPRLLVDDCSPERLASLLNDHGGRMAVMAPEGDVFDLLAGRYSGGAPNLGVFLRGHAGDDLRVDRVGRPPEFVRAPALTLGLTVQPEVIAGLAEKPGFRGRGLLGRFLFALPESFVGRRVINPAPVPDALRDGYERNVTALLRLPAGVDAGGVPVPWVLGLDAAARAALERFEAGLEPRLGEFGDLGPIADWAGKLVGAVVRVAGLLHLAEHVGRDEPWQVPIAAATMEAAIELAGYLIAHARAAFGLMGADPVVAEARHVLRWIQAQDAATLSKRDIFLGTRGRFKRVEALDPVLSLLVNHGVLVEQEMDVRPGPGRRPSPVYAVAA